MTKRRQEQAAIDWAERFDLPQPGQPAFEGLWPLQVQNMLTGEDVVIVGTGPSFKPDRNADEDLRDYWTISCNRACDHFDPTFALCFEPYYDRSCWDSIRNASPQFVITSDEADVYRRQIKFPSFPGRLFGKMPEIGCSGYYAAIVATWMGAKNVVMLGSADFHGHPKLGTTESLKTLRLGFAMLQEMLTLRGGQLLKVNDEPQLLNALGGVAEIVDWDLIQPRVRPSIATEHGRKNFAGRPK